MANTFDWVEIRTTDIEKTASFYEALFGWKVVEKEATEGSDYWIFDTGDKPRVQNIQRGGMWLRSNGESLGIVIYVIVDDVERILRKVTELGGEVLVPKTPQGSAFKAYFRDINGNMFGLWEEKSVD